MSVLPLEARLAAALASAESLPSLPAVAVEVLRLAKSEDAGVDEFVAVLSRDPALAAKLLKLANSALFRVEQGATTLERACVILGLKTVQMMSLGFSLRGAFDAAERDGAFGLKACWRRSLVAAVAARSYCRLAGRGLEDEAFLCGLLSHIGQLVMAQCMAIDYPLVIEQAAGAWPTPELESEVLGFNRCDVGGAVLASWKLPAAIAGCVAHAARPEDLPADASGELRSLTAILHAALCTTGVLLDAEKGRALCELRAAAARDGLADAELDAYLLRLEQEIAETADLLDVALDEKRSHAEILEDARQQLARLSLDAAADLQRAERRAHGLESKNRQLAQEATTDRLTGLANRAGFDAALAREVRLRSSELLPKALGLLLIDVDHFKRFNDAHGHRAGDQVLRALGKTLRKLTRASDLPARYGGEEFALILPEVTPEGLVVLAERVRRAIEAMPVRWQSTDLRITVSIGGACLLTAHGPQDAGRLIQAADEAMYAAKNAGRNRCSIETAPLALGA